MLHAPSPHHHHLAINVECQTFPLLAFSSRKTALQHVWLNVTQGGVLIRLGKNDYFFEQGKSLWIPANCLTALTYLPNTQVVQVSFSQRLNLPFATSAGVVSSNSIVDGVFERLATQVPLDKAYLEVLSLEACELTPSLEAFKSAGATLFTTESVSSNQIATLKHACAVRDAQKNALSGSSLQHEFEKVKARLGDDPAETWFAFTGQTVAS